MKPKNFRNLFPCLFILLITFSCTKDNPDQTVEKLTLGGEEIFKGMFFLESNFVELVPILENTVAYRTIQEVPNIKENINEIADLIVQDIHDNHPDFFTEFQELMKSKNHYNIVHAIDLGTARLQEAFPNVFNFDPLTDKELLEIVQNENIKDFIDKDGKIDEEAFRSLIEKHEPNDIYTLQNSSGECVNVSLMITTIAVLAVAVLVGAVIAIAAAVNGGTVVNLGAVVNVHAVVNATHEVNITGGGGGPDGGPGGDEKANTNANLEYEMLINQLAGIAY